MKIFISYKFADEDPSHLKEFMQNVKSSLKKSNHELFSTFFHQEEFAKSNATMRQIMDKALEYINQADTVLCVVKSKEKSEGQIFEIGYSIAKKKKVILAIQKGFETRWISHYADRVIEFENLEDLYKQLEKI